MWTAAGIGTKGNLIPNALVKPVVGEFFANIKHQVKRNISY